MIARIIPTPVEDAEKYNNLEGGYVRRTSQQLQVQAQRSADHVVAQAKEKADLHGLSILTGRVDLHQLRSDEVEEFLDYLQAGITSLIELENRYTVPVFALYERNTETAVLENLRDVTFNAALL